MVGWYILDYSIIGASLSEPHTSRNRLCLLTRFDRHFVNVQFSFKQRNILNKTAVYTVHQKTVTIVMMLFIFMLLFED